TARRLVKPGQVFNRIHVADIAGALWHLAERDMGGIFNVTDDLPSPPQDVVAYAAGLMKVEPPSEIPFETANFRPWRALSMARTSVFPMRRSSESAIASASPTTAPRSLPCGRRAIGPGAKRAAR